MSLPREVEARRDRTQGMSEEARVRLREFNESQGDWWGNCRKCGARVQGTLKALREHVCGTE